MPVSLRSAGYSLACVSETLPNLSRECKRQFRRPKFFARIRIKRTDLFILGTREKDKSTRRHRGTAQASRARNRHTLPTEFFPLTKGNSSQNAASGQR